MKLVTEADSSMWLRKNAVLGDLTASQRHLKLREKGNSYPSPTDALTSYDLARFFWAHLSEGEILVLQIARGVFTNEEELLLYDTYIKHFTGVGHQEERHGVLVSKADREHFVNLVSMNMMFKWDCLIADSVKNILIELNHDGLFFLVTSNAEFLKALKELGYS